MKLKISKKQLDNLIKEEALKLKSEHINETSAKEKISLLENKISQLDEEMREVYEGQELDEETASALGITQEIFGLSKFEKATKAYKKSKENEIGVMLQAYKKMDPSYVAASQALVKQLQRDVMNLAKQFGIEGSDVSVLYKDLLKIIQPMDYITFKKQSEAGGSRFVDIAKGASSGSK